MAVIISQGWSARIIIKLPLLLINTLRFRQNGHNFAGDIRDQFSLSKIVCFYSNKLNLKFVPEGCMDGKLYDVITAPLDHNDLNYETNVLVVSNLISNDINWIFIERNFRIRNIIDGVISNKILRHMIYRFRNVWLINDLNTLTQVVVANYVLNHLI